MKLGRHLSISKGIDRAIVETEKIDTNSLQIFTKSPRSWKRKVLKEEEIIKTKQNLEAYNIKGFVVHASYLINLATPSDKLYFKSIDEMIEDIRLSTLINADYFVFHPGNYLTSNLDQGINRIVSALNRIIKKIDHKPMLLIENTAGAGTEIGSNIDQLKLILDKVDCKDKFGLCLDTCHLFAAGYNLSEKEGIDNLIKELDKEIGINRLKLIHLNDSKFELATNKDRHQHLGKGKIGLDNFSYIINHPKLKDKLFIVETPPFDQVDHDIQTILNLIGE